jgi:hypothetical protein
MVFIGGVLSGGDVPPVRCQRLVSGTSQFGCVNCFASRSIRFIPILVIHLYFESAYYFNIVSIKLLHKGNQDLFSFGLISKLLFFFAGVRHLVFLRSIQRIKHRVGAQKVNNKIVGADIDFNRYCILKSGNQ